MFSSADDNTFQHKLLWAAVLRRAVFDYVLYKGAGHHRREWQYAYRFIFSYNMQYENGLSFEQVCEMLGWDPDYIRRLTTQMTRADIKKMEFNTFKEELTFQDKLTMAAERVGRWSGTRLAVPKFPPYNFPPELRESFTPRPVYRHYTDTHPNLEIRWQAGAVA